MNVSRKGTGESPPGPKGLPLVGNLLEFRRDPMQFLTNLAREYGDIAAFRLGSKRIVQLSEPSLIQRVLVTEHRKFVKTGVLKRAHPILGNGLVASDGEMHRRQRRLMQPSMNRQRIPAYSHIFTDTAKEFTARWQNGQIVDIAQEMLHLTLDIVARALFSIDIRDEASEIEQALTTVLEHFNSLLTRPHVRWLSRLPTKASRDTRAAIEYLDRFVYRMIEERRKNPDDRGDVLSMLLLAQDVEGDGERMSDQQVRDEVMTLLTAGHETIATALAWTWHCLSENEEAHSELQAEVDAVRDDRPFTADDLPKLKAVERALAESMRLYPPVWGITRKAVEPFEVGGYTLPAGTVIGLTQFVTHRDPRYFPEPERFDPERWQDEAKSQRPRYSYFPFGGGPRLCIGEPFAWMEGVLVLATIAREWELQTVPGQCIEFQPLLTLRPKHGLQMKLRRREPQPVSPPRTAMTVGAV